MFSFSYLSYLLNIILEKLIKRMKRGRADDSLVERDHIKRAFNGEKDNNSHTEILDSIKIHPLLQLSNKNKEDKKDEVVKDVNKKVIINNPLLNDWKQRAGYVINPYIEQSDISMVPVRKKTLSLKMNEPGKYIRRGEIIREKLREERLDREKEAELKRLNLIPDKSIGEDKYEEEFKEPPPYIEWWDLSYLKKGDRRGCKYEGISEEVVNYKDSESEDNPITSYIQHPVPIESPWSRIIPKPKPLYLTKKEQKRLRKNRRMIALQEKRDKIKLGLEPVPAPKVKLKNLMNVLTNETIRNPTEVEMRVRSEIQEREDLHHKMNAERKINKEDKKVKIERKNQEDKEKGIIRCVFGIKRLINPKNIYKVDMNAKQLMINGVCLNLKGGKSIVIVEGGYKSIEKYKKLMMRRIDWSKNEVARDRRKQEERDLKEEKEETNKEVELEDLSNNRCELIWEGEVIEEKFSKWSKYDYNMENEIEEFLSKFGMENYWQQVGLKDY